ncbi:hypothetical protein F441_13918 [Phytophthora nicotianae CJ01A1]|uniref:Uncharacterized protein n=2 Tax=Phytophthora nicotianae TaxID=4792 RepID=W2MYI7_PHYNI|nr:hypothetical protein L915_13625 [Phytophthora nicotianae]ETL34214.1 hypothetical protein L916_13522 [Phytophthora nicotianae]ETM40718.1 hypothetical protein L914_13424 [Phytophthora nicotianae]ETP10456.1 hypothetical protein F441_13918 [Phytophthora nicotianae CJ01A1]
MVIDSNGVSAKGLYDILLGTTIPFLAPPITQCDICVFEGRQSEMRLVLCDRNWDKDFGHDAEYTGRIRVCLEGEVEDRIHIL